MSIDQAAIDGWLRDMGLEPQPLPNAQVRWQLEFAYPIGSTHRMAVFGPRDRPRAIVVATAVQIAEEHVRAFDSLDEEAKSDFRSEFIRALNHDFVEFSTKGTEDGRSCPRYFEVTATRFDDGLTLDSFARSVSSVYKIELAGIQCVQRHLGGQGFGESGRFDFRRFGL